MNKKTHSNQHIGMDNTKKTLKSPLSAKFNEIKAKAAGEAQKSLAREILSRVEAMESHVSLATRKDLFWMKDFLKQIIK